MIILALDLATITGWCRGAPGETPTYGSIGKKGRSHPAIFGELQKWLITETAGDKRPDVIAYEMPILRPTDTGDVVGILWGLAAIVQATAYQRGIHNDHLMPIKLDAMRKFFLGKSKWKREDGKAAAVRKCRNNLKLDPQDDNAAEAIGHWCYAGALLVPQSAHRSSPIFSTRVKVGDALI